MNLGRRCRLERCSGFLVNFYFLFSNSATLPCIASNSPSLVSTLSSFPLTSSSLAKAPQQWPSASSNASSPSVCEPLSLNRLRLSARASSFPMLFKRMKAKQPSLITLFYKFWISSKGASKNTSAFGKGQVTLPANVIINEHTIDQVKYTKFLGIYIDEELSWKYHIKHIASKISKMTSIMAKARHHLTSKTLLTLYQTVIYPHLYYCSNIWVSTYPTRLLSIFKTEENCKDYDLLKL